MHGRAGPPGPRGPTGGTDGLNVQALFGATGDGTTDDAAAIQAAITASPGRTLVVPAGTYLIGTTLTLAAADTRLIFLPGAKLKKTAGFTASYGVRVTAAGVSIDAPIGQTILDGNRAAGSAGQGIQWEAAGGAIRGGKVTSNKSTGIRATGAGVLDCYDVASDDNVSGTAAGDGFLATADGLLRTYRCSANANDRCGFFFANSAAELCHLDGKAARNLVSGASIRSSKGTGGSFFGYDNTSFGLSIEYGGNNWVIDSVVTERNGETDANASGTGVELFGAYRIRLGTVISNDHRGYGAVIAKLASATNSTLNGAIDASVTTITVASAANWAKSGVLICGTEYITYTSRTSTILSGCKRGALGSTAATHADTATIGLPSPSLYNEIGTVITNNLSSIDSDPGLTISGASSNNQIGTLIAVGQTVALSFGEQVTGDNSDNVIGRIEAIRCSYAVLRCTHGSNNEVGEILARDCWNTDTGTIADALLYFTGADSLNNRIGRFRHRTTNAAAPNAIFNQVSSATGNTVESMSGTGSPEAAVAAPPGCTYSRLDPASADTVLYVKATGNGNTGWTAVKATAG